MAGLGGSGQSSGSDITIWKGKWQDISLSNTASSPIHFPFKNSILFQYSNLENLLITGIHFCNRCKHLTPQQVKQAFCQAIHKTGLPALESNPIHFYYSQNWIRTLNNGLKNKCKGHVLQYLPSVLRGRMSHCRSEMLKFRGREEYISDGNL